MKRREKILLALAGIAAIIVAVYYVIWPRWNNYNEWQKQISNNIDKIRTAQRTAAKIDQLVKNMTEIKRKLKRSRQKLPKESKFNELMSRIEQEARKAGIPGAKIVSINQGPTKERKLIKEMSIRAKFERITMSQLARMLWRFDNMIEMADIKSFNSFKLSRVKTKDGDFLFNADLKIAVYIMKDSAKIKAEKA